MPICIRHLHAMETLLLSFNKMDTLDRFPWSELKKASVVSISDNKLRSLGDIYHVPQLASLSFENNNLTQVPCELGLCPHLRAIYMNGNPQKTVRGGVIAKGSLEILTYLKNKFPPNAVLPPPSPAMKRDTHGEEGQVRRFANPSSTLVASRPGKSEAAAMHAAHHASRSNDLRREEYASSTDKSPVAKTHHKESKSYDGNDNDAIRKVLQELTRQIEQLELELENHALSAPKRYAMKKELAVLRSTRIREERKLS